MLSTGENGSPFQRLVSADELLDDGAGQSRAAGFSKALSLVDGGRSGSVIPGRNPSIISKHRCSQAVLRLIESHLHRNL